MRVVVLTVDQHGSRTRPDEVPAALEALAAVPTLLAFQRTVGDELQGVLDDPAALARALELLLRAAAWNIGIGIGEIETPLPDQARAGRGPAYLAAREAVTAAKSSPWRLRASGPTDTARALESAVWLWAALLGTAYRPGLGGRRPGRPGADLRRDRHPPRDHASRPSASGLPRPGSPKDAEPASWWAS